MDSIAYLRYYFYYVASYIRYIVSFVASKLEKYPTEVKVAAVISVLCAFTMVALFIKMLFMSRNRKTLRLLREHTEETYSDAMKFLLSSKAPDLMSREEICQLFGVDPEVNPEPLKKAKEKQVFAEVFYNLFINEKSESARMGNIHTMLEIFGIPEHLEKEVSLSVKKNKVNALNMIRAYGLSISPWIINKLLNSKNLRLQRLAMYTVIVSSSDSSMDYFETEFFDNNSCIKDEIELAYSLNRRRKAGLKLPNLARWAHMHKREFTQCLFVRLMRRFNHVEYCEQLKDLFSQGRKKKLIEEISRTWGYLHYVDGEQLMIDSLLTQPDDTKVAIMHALTRFGTGRGLDAMLDGFRHSNNPHVRYEALRCLYNYGTEGRAAFDKLELEATEEDSKYFSFFHNPITLAKVRLDREQAYHPSVETVLNG